jgi:excisionase family DNA binding protein
MSAATVEETTTRRFLSLTAAARRAGVSKKTVRVWIAQGGLHTYRPNPRGLVLVEAAELDAMILKSERQPAAAHPERTE